MWKPQEYAMWDSLAKKGLKALHGSQAGHCYNNNTLVEYDLFRTDFFELFDQVKSELFLQVADFGFEESAKDFAPRILDNYLMLLGKQT